MYFAILVFSLLGPIVSGFFLCLLVGVSVKIPLIVMANIFSIEWVVPLVLGLVSCLTLIIRSNFSGKEPSFRQLVSTFLTVILASTGFMFFFYPSIFEFHEQLIESVKWFGAALGGVLGQGMQMSQNLSCGEQPLSGKLGLYMDQGSSGSSGGNASNTTPNLPLDKEETMNTLIVNNHDLNSTSGKLGRLVNRYLST